MKKEFCFLFPGQSSHKPGMLRPLERYLDKISFIFDIAKKISGIDIKDLCMNGREEEFLKDSKNQYAIMCINLAYMRILNIHGIFPSVVLGHSLGQISALVAANVLDINDAFEIIKKRKELIDKYMISGCLVSVFGLEYSSVLEICKTIDTKLEKCSISLYNSKRQIVISCSNEDLDYFISLCKNKGAISCIKLPISNAFHSKYMCPILKEFSNFINSIDFKKNSCEIILNCKGDFAKSITDIKQDLVDQCTHEVKWVQSIQHLTDKYKKIYCIEVGNGNILGSLFRNINPNYKVLCLSKNIDLICKNNKEYRYETN